MGAFEELTGSGVGEEVGASAGCVGEESGSWGDDGGGFVFFAETGDRVGPEEVAEETAGARFLETVHLEFRKRV